MRPSSKNPEIRIDVPQGDEARGGLGMGRGQHLVKAPRARCRMFRERLR